MHTGLLTFGHYFCYIKKGNTWYLCNDQEVIGEKPENIVLKHIAGDGTGSANGYTLFYSRNDFCDIKGLEEMVDSYKFIEPISLNLVSSGNTPAPYQNSPNKNELKNPKYGNNFVQSSPSRNAQANTLNNSSMATQNQYSTHSGNYRPTTATNSRTQNSPYNQRP